MIHKKRMINFEAEEREKEKKTKARKKNALFSTPARFFAYLKRTEKERKK